MRAGTCPQPLRRRRLLRWQHGTAGTEAAFDDIAAKRVDTVVVYKVDRLTRSLADFAKIVEQFDKQGVSFVSVTQQFNTTTSMGRLTLNVLLSFAQFEREVTGSASATRSPLPSAKACGWEESFPLATISKIATWL